MTFLYCPDDRPLPDYAVREGLTICGRLPEKGVFLAYEADGIALCKAGEKGKVRVDFTAGKAAYRRMSGGGELIAKAVHAAGKPIVWDATGGLGRDAFVLAALGLQVRVFERHPAVFSLLADGLARAAQDGETAALAAAVMLHYGDAAQEMFQAAQTFGRPDVVYLDPMYPERQKSAAVKKEMAYFHELLSENTGQNDSLLFEAARKTAKKRVVVKRPRLGEFLCGLEAAYQYTGKSTRFDVYLPF